MLTVRKLQFAASQPQLLQIGRLLIGLSLYISLSISLGHDVIGPVLLINFRISLTCLALREYNYVRYCTIFILVQQPPYLTQSIILRGRNTFKYQSIIFNKALLEDSVAREFFIVFLYYQPAKIQVYCHVILYSIQLCSSPFYIYIGRILV